MPRTNVEERILILAPIAQDAAAMASVLQERRFAAEICDGARDASLQISRGAGALLLTEEALEPPEMAAVLHQLKLQPPWSELPLIVITRGGESRLARLLDLAAEAAGSLTLLERPIGEATLLRSVEVALRSRRRQYQVRDLLEERRRTEAALEQRVDARTAELVQSQERLRALASELNLAEQRERKRLATDLHDHLQQLLVLGKLKLGQGKRLVEPIPAWAKIVKETDEVLSEALQYTRTLVAELSPPVLRDHGLPAALQWLGEYMKKHEMEVTVIVPEGDGVTLPEEQAVLLFQSVRELLINSSKYAGTGRAWITMEDRRSILRITVRDEGAGFDLAALATEAAGAPPGAGVSSKFGLYSIRERMKALGGSFHLDSAPGQGTTATLVLPLARRDAREVREERDEQKSSGKPVSLLSPVSPLSRRARIRVLLVDDHAMVRQGLRAVLDGYHDIEMVGEAADGREAVRLVEQLCPAAVVMDINMPRMNGIEATREIKIRHPNVAVIGLSVNAGAENQDAMLKAGAAALLTKEAAVERLYETMQAVLKK
jgi:signal transduction histidine kinase/CheY-like chemotaxis protein